MKTVRRLYVLNQSLAAGNVISLSDNQAHYLGNVLRLGAGAEVQLFNAECGEWAGKIKSSKKQEIKIVLERQIRAPLVSCPLSLALYFAPLKKTRTDFVVEKASELGVHQLQPIMTDHTQSDRVNVERLQQTAIEAAEQCDRLDAPIVHAPLSFSAALRQIPQDALLLLAAESGTAQPIAAALQNLTPARQIIMIIGPEGGFSAAEFAAFDEMPQIHRLRLGPRMLRAETAAIAALSCVQAIIGDWR